MWKKILNSPAFLLACVTVVIAAVVLSPKTKSLIEAVADFTSPHAMPQSQEWTVASVADGETITVKRDGETKKIRFCGIDAVEKQQKLGAQAKSYLQSLIDKGNGVVMVIPIEQDRSGRAVTEVFVKPRPGTPGYRSEEEIFLNGEMVRAGFARHTHNSDNCPNELVIEQSQQMAIANRVGVWNDSNVVPR
ncbi:thermonuclease family protein [Nostoc sp. DedQUE09]|uniref:thermonuclease family protein n=1 Tax=Nostoc sp. DedQUE09 TaxID=3075394 RepID=UPI002AD2CE7B|nr:thermonuclease family protein [Nostoc sp. DedQUE09]MDZ7950615.1 thermonuclease family protein [Nostoc sp. DedQUE09]